MLVKKVIEVSFHRNGICGVGFHAIRFVADTTDEIGNTQKPDANFLGIVFDEPGYCSVICLDLIETCGVRFAGGNSWRGDRFEPELRKAIEENASSGSVRVGPFALPTDN